MVLRRGELLTLGARIMPGCQARDDALRALAGVVDRHIRDNYTSVREAARQWGMNDSTIGKIINNPKRIPEPETMRKLATGMGMSMRSLYALCGLGDPPSVEDADAELQQRALDGLSTADLEVLSQMTPDEKAAWIASARALLGRHR